MRIDNGNTRTTRTSRSTSTAPSAPPAPRTEPRPNPTTARQSRDSFESQERNASRFSSGAHNDMRRLARSPRATIATNRDGSVTRSQSNTRGQTTRTQELTTSQSRFGDTRLKFTTNSTTGGRETKNTYSARTDMFGRTQSSHQRESSFERGDVKQTRSRTTTVDSRGNQRDTRAESRQVTRGERSETTSSSFTTDSRGNRAWTQGTSTATTSGNTTTTRSTTRTGGTERTVQDNNSFTGGTFSLGRTTEQKNTPFNTERNVTRERQIRPSTADDGFSQNDRLSKVQQGGDLLAQAGAKKEWKNEFNHVTENNSSTDPNSFVGSRVGTSGSESFSVGTDGLNASYKREAKAGVYAETKGETKGKYGEASYTAGAKAEAKAGVDGNAKLNLNGLEATGRVGASASVEASATGKAATKSVKVAGVDVNAAVEGKVRASAEVSAEAQGTVKVTRNPPTAIAEGSAGASAVAKAEAEIKASAGPFSVKVDAYASAGAEAKATGVIGYEDGKLKIGGGLGAAVGLGAGASGTVEVDVKQIGNMAKNTAVKVADANGDGKLGLDDAKTVVDGAKNAVNDAKDKVADFFGF
ncbi:outer membrane protein [Cystobacter fuscus]|uniref:Outer membrane protein n=1 Tax=Cystobacter fuscus TaxID=43 RepID=A0A250JIT6_9BACT|nr:hypothetical protein [Cystobacter fuscus]ATB43056.1 outer membrane protein [Cystobacter fuscus]